MVGENKRLLVLTDKDEKLSLLWHCHTSNVSSHACVNLTLEKATSTHFWRGIKDDVKRYVSMTRMSFHRKIDY